MDRVNTEEAQISEGSVGSVDVNGISQNFNELQNRVENISIHLNKDSTYDQLNYEIQAQRTMIEKIQIESHQQATIIE